MRQLQNELSEEQFCFQLEDYLRQGDWRKADEETAWLFCSVMVQEGYSDWLELWEKFPSETLNEINQLWVDYSQGHFGFSIQKRIWEEVERDWQGSLGSEEEEKWEQFGTKVGWVVDVYEERWRDYEDMPFSRESEKGNLPALIWCREGRPREGFNDQQWWVDPGLTHMKHNDALILFSRIQT